LHEDARLFIKDKRDQGARTDLKSVCDIVQTRGLAAAVADYPEVYVKFHSGIEKLNAFYRGIPRDQKPYVVWIIWTNRHRKDKDGV